MTETCFLISFVLKQNILFSRHAAGLESEGLYRMAGFHDDVEAIKICFDKGEQQMNNVRILKLSSLKNRLNHS